MRRLIVLLSALVLCLAASAQTRPVREFRTTLDSVDVHIQERTGKGNEDKGNILFFRNPVAYKPVAYARDLHFNGVVHYEDKG